MYSLHNVHLYLPCNGCTRKQGSCRSTLCRWSTLLKLEVPAEEAKVKKEDQSLPQTEPLSDSKLPRGDSEALRESNIKAEPDSGDAGQAQVLGHSESLHAPDGAQLAAEDIKRDPDIAAEPSSHQGGPVLLLWPHF